MAPFAGRFAHGLCIATSAFERRTGARIESRPLRSLFFAECNAQNVGTQTVMLQVTLRTNDGTVVESEAFTLGPGQGTGFGRGGIVPSINWCAFSIAPGSLGSWADIRGLLHIDDPNTSLPIAVTEAR